MNEEISVDTTSASVTLQVSGTYTADELTALLNRIGKARAQLAQDDPEPPAVLAAAPPGVGRYWVQSMDAKLCLIAMQHPGFGWLAWRFEHGAVAQLIANLATQLRHGFSGGEVNESAPSGGSSALH